MCLESDCQLRHLPQRPMHRTQLRLERHTLVHQALLESRARLQPRRMPVRLWRRQERLQQLPLQPPNHTGQ